MVYFAALSHGGSPGARAGAVEPSVITALGPSGPTVFWKRCVSSAAPVTEDQIPTRCTFGELVRNNSKLVN